MSRPYNRVEYKESNGFQYPYWDIKVQGDPPPSPSPTPSISPSVSVTPTASITPTPSTTPSSSGPPSPTPSITPSITPSTLPNDSPSEVDQYFSSPTSPSYGCFSLSGTGYVEKINLTTYQFVEGTHPDGNNYSFYIKNLSADTVVLTWMTDDRNEPKVWEWTTAYFPNKTSTGWTDGETFPSLNSQRTTAYTDNTSTNGYHYPSRSGLDYNCTP